MSHTFTSKIFVEFPKCPNFWDIWGIETGWSETSEKIAFYHYLIFSLDKSHFPSMQTRLTHKTRLFLADCFALSGIFIEDNIS